MINVRVISLNDIVKLIKKTLVLCIIGIMLINCMSFIKNKGFFYIKKVFDNQVSNIDKNILISNYFNNQEFKNNNTSGIRKILASELIIFSQEYELMEKENQEETVDYIDTTITMNEKSLDIAQEFESIQNNDVGIEEPQTATNNTEIPYNLETKILEKNNKIDKYTDIYHSVKIKNESKYELTDNIINPDIDFSNKKDIIIYHTHTCESYTPTEENNYIASGNFRTIDLNYSVSRVGSELSNYLDSFGFNVIHNNTYHDYPAYTGSYTRSLSTINSILSNNNAEFVIDLHRDALGSNSSYAPSVQIGDDIAAQLMFVIRN